MRLKPIKRTNKRDHEFIHIIFVSIRLCSASEGTQRYKLAGLHNI